MKSVGHAWAGLMALERLKKPKRKGNGYIRKNHKSFYLGNKFNKYYKEQANKFVGFFDKHKDAFVIWAMYNFYIFELLASKLALGTELVCVFKGVRFHKDTLIIKDSLHCRGIYNIRDGTET